MTRRRPTLVETSRVVAALALLGAVGLAGCGGDDGSPTATDPSSGPGSSSPERDGPRCPRSLPQHEDPADGYETLQPAAEAPTLEEPESAWVCGYQPAGLDGPAGSQESMWVRGGAAVPVPEDRLGELSRHLGGLRPADPGRMCTLELGPRSLVVYPSGEALVGVVVDHFGCRDVRLTDDPFEVVPGDGTGSGTVPGVLSGPPELEALVSALGS